MGGYGSGRPREKTTVEECLALSANRLMSGKVLGYGLHYSGTLTWTRVATGEKISAVEFEVDTRDPAEAWIRLYYTMTRSGEKVDYRVGLTTTALPWGGVRWWFVCPLTVNGQSCGRRRGKLYLPPGGRYFGCRLCYNLTYTSSQEAHKFDGLHAKIGADLGIPPWMVKHLLKA